jgi:hypothetical protein
LFGPGWSPIDRPRRSLRASQRNLGGGPDPPARALVYARGASGRPLPSKIAIGTVRAYKDDRRRLSLRPAAKVQGQKPLGFKVRKNAQVTLDGKQAELADIQEGQQAQIRYVVKNEINRAIIVQLFSKQPSGQNKKKKQPPGEDGKKQPPRDAEKTG